jgi:hypothetical protein
VTVTESGPWTAVPGETGVLNPQGDVNADGAPAVASSEAGSLVAWCAESSGSLRLARATNAWLPTLVVRAPEATGTPLIVPVDAGWVVATRQRDGRVLMSGLVNEGSRVSGLLPLGEGRLLTGRRAGADAIFTLLNRNGCIETVRVHLLVPDPRPIEVYRTQVCPPHSEPVPPRRMPGPGRIPAPGDHDGFRRGDDGSGDGSSGDGASGDGDRCGESFEGDPIVQPITMPDGSVVTRVQWRTPSGVAITDIGD